MGVILMLLLQIFQLLAYAGSYQAADYEKPLSTGFHTIPDS